MADEEFEIDLYDDANNEQAEQTEHKGEDSDSHTYNHDDGHAHGGQDANGDYADEQYQDDMDQQEHDSTDQYPPQQGTKRKEAHDDRPVDPGATTAILISELNWWNTDDEIRGWARQAGCESELRDITFSEHKVNGKCKG